MNTQTPLISDWLIRGVLAPCHHVSLKVDAQNDRAYTSFR